MPNYFSPSMAQVGDEDLMKENYIANPEAVAIDNSPGMMMQMAQAALKAGATAVGGKAGAIVADGVTNSYNKSQEMPNVQSPAGQKAMQSAMSSYGTRTGGGPLASEGASHTMSDGSTMAGSTHPETSTGSSKLQLDENGKLIQLSGGNNTSNMSASYNPDGMEMDKRIYDDFIIKDLLEQGIILPSEIQNIQRDGYKQIGGPLMGVA